jgi:ELWxxDGT repeat protein
MTKTLLRLSIILLILGLFLGSAHAAPPEPYLVKDIYQAGDSSPSALTVVNGTLFFAADDVTHGVELWKSDGTAAGTVLVKDINPGAGDSDPNWLTNVNGRLFFRADDGTNGSELWQSDGTAAGTVLVKDIHPAGDSSPHNLTDVNGTLFFAADDGTTGIELWALLATQKLYLPLVMRDS